MATKIIRYRPQNGDIYHFETEKAAIVDFPDVSKYLTKDTQQGISGTKIFVGNGVLLVSESGYFQDEVTAFNEKNITRTANRLTYQYDFPNDSGEIALTKNIPDTSNLVTIDTKQNITATKTFRNATIRIGISGRNTSHIEIKNNGIDNIYPPLVIGRPSITYSYTFPLESGEFLLDTVADKKYALKEDVQSGGAPSFFAQEDVYVQVNDVSSLYAPKVGHTALYFVNIKTDHIIDYSIYALSESGQNDKKINIRDDKSFQDESGNVYSKLVFSVSRKLEGGQEYIELTSSGMVFPSNTTVAKIEVNSEDEAFWFGIDGLYRSSHYMNFDYTKIEW